MVAFALLGFLALGGRVTAARGVESVTKPPARPTLRVVSYTIRHGVGMDGTLDLDRTAALLRRLEPDVVALQEVDERCRRSGNVDQAAALGKALGMEHRFGEFMDHDGGRYGLAVLSRLPIKATRRHELPRGAEPRCALEVELDVPGLGQPVSFTCIHMERTKEAIRVAQMRALVAALGERRPAIVAGDFNGEPGSESLALLADAGWRILAKDGARGSNPTWPADEPMQEIDHVAERGLPEYAVSHDVIDEQVASDHRPLLAVFSFAVGAAAAPPEILRKIGFDLDGLDANGLAGAADGKVSISYEFRIPDTPENRAAVKAIDPSLEIASGPRGRVDAGPGFALCIGSTHQPRHREIVLTLARLPFVERIQPCVFEH
ncbi:MAG: endonuclease/exonuclease/phosphatase family protein [Planctomycetota bacterium]